MYCQSEVRMAHMEKARWEKVLGKFKKDELPVMAAQHLGLKLSPKAKTKREMVSLILEANLTPSDLLEVELTRISSQPNSVVWRVYRLEYPDISALPPPDGNTFTKKLERYLGSFFDLTMVHFVEPTGWWFGMHINDRCLPPYTCYMFYSSPSPTLFLTGVKRGHLVTVLEAVNLTLGSVKYVEMDLSGKDLSSLREMVCNQFSQGSRSAYRLNQVDPNPLLVANGHTLPSLSHTHSTENQQDEDRQLKAATDTFGANPLPKIEKFTFKLCADLPDDSDTVHCQVTLTGSSVLEGTKAAIAADHFTLPIPEVISEMPSLASNVVSLEDS